MLLLIAYIKYRAQNAYRYPSNSSNINISKSNSPDNDNFILDFHNFSLLIASSAARPLLVRCSFADALLNAGLTYTAAPALKLFVSNMDPFEKANLAMMGALKPSGEGGGSGGGGGHRRREGGGGGNRGRQRGDDKPRRRRRRCPPPPAHDPDFVPAVGATCDGPHSFVVPEEIMAPAIERVKKRMAKFSVGDIGDASQVKTPDPLSLFLDAEDPSNGGTHNPEDHGVLIRNYGDVHHVGYLTLLLGPVSSSTGNTVVCWGMVPRHVGNFSFNIAVGDNHETFLLHFNPRYERNKKFCRLMFGTKRDYIWDQGGDELDHRWVSRYIRPGEQFEWRCTVCSTGFAVFLNGHFVWKYDHRVPAAEIDKPLKFHVAGDQDNDNVAVRGVWWGYIDPAVSESLSNPTLGDGDGDADMGGLGDIDVISEEAMKKMQAREARFGTSSAAVIGGNGIHGEDDSDVAELTPEEQERRAARKARFGGDQEGDGVEDDGEGMELESTVKRREVPHDIKVSLPLFCMASFVLFVCCPTDQVDALSTSSAPLHWLPPAPVGLSCPLSFLNGIDTCICTPTCEQRRRNVIHIYGCDHMVQRDLKVYFSGFDLVGVRWLDDSSCNVQFKDEFTAKNALFKRITPEAQAEAREAGLDVFGLNWLEALPYKKSRSDSFGSKGSMTKMWIRLATVQDVTHKGMDRPLVQSSTLAGQAAAAGGTFGSLMGGGSDGAAAATANSASALAAAGQAAWNQLMSTHNQNKRNRRKKKRRQAKGASGAAAMRRANDNASRDAEFEKYAQAAKEARAAAPGN